MRDTSIVSIFKRSDWESDVFAGASNSLLKSIARTDRSAFVADLKPLELQAKKRLVAAGVTASAVYFPNGAVLSVVYACDGAAIELHGAGRDGMFGADSLFAPQRMPFDLMCQIGGSVLSMPFDTFKTHVRHNVGLTRTLSLYSLSVTILLRQSAACNALHTIARRCARWLLITADRVGTSEFALTHEMLARLLGAQRSGVSLAVQRLQQLGLIAYRSGWVQIVDRAELEAQSCECYGIVVRETARIFKRRS